MTQTPLSPLTRVSRDLTDITRLWGALEEQAIALASAQIDGHSLPGGEAMVALGPVASLEAWGWLEDATERTGKPYTSETDEDADDDWLPYQILRFWSEKWRARRGEDYELRGGYTLATETAYIRSALDWARDNEPAWDAFVANVRTARAKLENIVHSGTRPAFTGASCMYDSATLVRYTRPARDKAGRKVWVLSDWQCPRCRRTWDEDAYARNLHAAGESLHYRNIDGETWWSEQRAAERIGRPASTVRVWVHRDQVTSQVVDGRVYVYPPDVQARDELARARAAKRKAGRVDVEQSTAV